MRKIVGRQLSKLGLKPLALKVYFFQLHLFNDIVRKYREFLIPILINKRSKKGIYAINIDSDWIGLGARIVKTLEILKYCEDYNFTPVIQYAYREKGTKKNNYFEDLFQYKNITLNNRNVKFTHIRDIDELQWEEDYNKKLELKNAKSLFDKYIVFNTPIIHEVEEFTVKNFANKKVLGIHYRGTDKAGEAPLVTKESLIASINDLLQTHKFDVIFISTDDQSILEFVINSNLTVPVIYREDHFRSSDGDQVHRKEFNSKYMVNRDAAINMLLLSKCNLLLKTASILSDCSVIFNPSIPIKLLSKPHSENLTWWPAREIIQNVQFIKQIETEDAIIEA